MSLSISAMVWRARLPSTQKLVALRLADFAWDDGSRVFPSNARVARECGLTDRSVRDTMRALEAVGVLELVALERPGQHLPREYRFSLETLAALAMPDPAEGDPAGSEAPGGTTFRAEPPSGRNHVPPAFTDQGEEGSSLSPAPGGSTFRPEPPSARNVVPHQGEARSANPLRDPLRDREGGAGARDEAAGTPAPPKRTRTAPDDEPEGFADWYAAYPRKRDPGQARKAYRAALRKASPAVLLMAARAYADDCRRTGRDPKFIKHPTTWLNAEAWTNPPELTEGGFHHGQHTRSPAQEPRGAAAVEQLLARLGEGSGNAQRGADDGPGLYRPAWDLDLSATPAPDDPPGGE